MDFINKPIAWLLDICYGMTSSYVLALFVFAIMVKIILLPLGIKQHSNSLKQASLRPKEAAIIKKYKGRNDRQSQQKRQMEIQEIQQRAGYSQLAGCLPLIIQLPIIIIIYNVIRSPLTYLCGFAKGTVDAVKGVAAGILGAEAAKLDEIAVLSNMHKDLTPYAGIEGVTKEALPNFFLFGNKIDLSQTPEFGANILMLIPILTFCLTFATAKLTRKLSYQSPVMEQQSRDAKTSMFLMDLMLPLISTWITFSVPGVIGVYWMYQSILGVLQQFIMVKVKPYPVFTEEDYKEAEREILGKKKKIRTGRNKDKDPNRVRPRSLHHIDDDEYNAHVVDTPDEAGESKVSADPKGLLTPMPMKDEKDKK